MIYKENAISIKIPMAFSTEIKKKNQQFTWSYKRQKISKAILRKKSKAALCTTISDYTTQGSSPCLLCLLFWQKGSLPLALPGKHRHIDQ